MTYKDIETINSFILLLSFDNEKKERPLSIKFKNKLLKLTNSIQSELTIINKLRNDLFQKYGKASEDAETMEIIPENREIFLKEIEDMLNIESDCDTHKLDEEETLDALESIGLAFTFQDLNFLQKHLFKVED